MGKLKNYNLLAKHGNGNVIELNVTKVPVYLENAIVGVYMILKDITYIKRKREELRESEERYRFLADNALDLITRHCPNGSYFMLLHLVTDY